MSEKGFDYYTVFHKMTQDEINEANIALDLYEKAAKKHLKK